jgi:CheY-like chemotaxis protein
MTAETAAKILIVEDEALLLYSIADELRAAGFVVLEAVNADAAIALLESDPDISLLFTDIDMPGSMDGLKLSAAVRDRWPPVKILVTSGKARIGERELPIGGQFMPKPYSTASVVLSIGSLLGRH